MKKLFKCSAFLLASFLFPACVFAGSLIPDYQESIDLAAAHGDSPATWVPQDDSIVYIPGDGSTDAQYGLKYDAGGKLIVRSDSRSSYYKSNYVGQADYKILGFKALPSDDAAWVTTGNDATRFLTDNGVTGDNVTTLLERGLGMNTAGDHNIIMEFTVSPDNNTLLRPTKDPDITVYSKLSSDYGTGAGFVKPPGMTDTVYGYFQKYYDDWKKSALDNRTFPWSQIGYTFFWGNGTALDDIKGMSEFILLAKTPANIYGMYAARSYIYTRNDGANFSSAAGSQYGNGFPSFNIDGSCDTVWAGHRFQKNTGSNIAAPNEVIVTGAGSVSGGSGILIWSLNYDVTNDGVISGTTSDKFAVAGTSDIAVLFKGDTSADFGTPILVGINRLTNSGTISSPQVAVRADAGDTEIINNNDGVLSGGAYAVITGAGNDSVTVRGGRVRGNIDLGSGTDSVDVTNAHNNADLYLTLDRDAPLSARIEGAETVSIADNTSFTLALSGSDNVRDEESFLIADVGPTGTLTVNPAALSFLNDPEPMVSFRASQSGSRLFLIASRDNSYYGASCGNPSLGSTLDSLADSATGDMAVVIGALDASGDPADAQKLEPCADNGAVNTSFDSMTQYTGTIIEHMNGGSSSGVSTGDLPEGSAVWARGYGNYQHQAPRGDSNGYNASTWGTALGFDAPAAVEGLTLGICPGFSQSFVRSKDSSARNDINSFQISGYGSFEEHGFYLDEVLSFAYNTYDGSRRISFGALDRTASGDYGGQQYSSYTEAGYTFNFQGASLTPLASILYSRLNLDSYTESGAGAASLKVASQGYDMLQTGLGARAEHPFKAKQLSITPAFHAKWLYDILAENQESTSSFTGGGASFATSGFKPAKSCFILGPKLSLDNAYGLSVTFNYDLQLKEDFYGHAAYVDVRCEF